MSKMIPLYTIISCINLSTCCKMLQSLRLIIPPSVSTKELSRCCSSRSKIFKDKRLIICTHKGRSYLKYINERVTVSFCVTLWTFKSLHTKTYTFTTHISHLSKLYDPCFPESHSCPRSLVESSGVPILSLIDRDGWMNGVLGHFYALSRLNWAGDNLG